MIDANRIVGTHDVLFITLDTLRYDVARDSLAAGATPNLARWLPDGVWEERHSPGNFTFAAHAAFFAGFLPTPTGPGPHPRLLALQFDGSETTCDQTLVFDAPNIVEGFAQRGYHTLCIGGVGFFNQRNPLGRVFPSMFQESKWCTSFGVTDPDSTRNQVDYARERIAALGDRRLFLFLNVSALHQPNRHYVPGATADSIASHAAALHYVDSQLPHLIEAMTTRAPLFCIVCSDHGTLYGEEGHVGHRVSHPAVWNVPYAHFLLPQSESAR